MLINFANGTPLCIGTTSCNQLSYNINNEYITNNSFIIGYF